MVASLQTAPDQLPSMPTNLTSRCRIHHCGARHPERAARHPPLQVLRRVGGSIEEMVVQPISQGKTAWATSSIRTPGDSSSRTVGNTLLEGNRRVVN